MIYTLGKSLDNSICDFCSSPININDKVGWHKYSPDIFCENCFMNKFKYIFVTTKMSISSILEKHGSNMMYMGIDIDYEEYINIPNTSLIMIDCTNNFSEEELKIINGLNIYCIEDLLINCNINKTDKQRCLEKFNFSKIQYELNKIESSKSYLFIQIDKYVILIRILSTGAIKYCLSAGVKDIESIIKFK